MEEIVVNPHTGRWWTVGTYGAEFVDIPKNAIVFNHKQSKALLENGSIFSRGKALAGGTAMIGGAESSLNTSGSGTGSGSGNSSNNSDTKTSNSDSQTKIDWIEIAISRVKRSLENFANVVSDASRSYARRMKNLAKEIGTTKKEITVQQGAYNKYMQAANSVKLSSELKAKVRNGAISFGNYGDETQKAIKEYQEFYEKALESADAVKELNRSLAELYSTSFELISGKYDNKIATQEYRAEMRQSSMDLRESKGKVAKVKDYEYLIGIEQKKQELNSKKVQELTSELDKALKSGAIKRNSQQHYDLLSDIRDANKSVAESKTAQQDYRNSIRDAYVDRFEKKSKSYDRTLSTYEAKSNSVQSRIDLAEANGALANIGDYAELRKIELNRQKTLASKSQTLQAELDRALKSGYLDKTMDEYWDMVDSINSVNQELDESQVSIANFDAQIKQLKIDKFNEVVEGFDARLDENTHEQNIQQGKMDLREAQGKDGLVSDIQKLIDLEWKRQFILQEEVKRLKTELKDSGFKQGTKEYKELASQINAAEETLQESNVRIATLNKNITELKLQKFNDRIEKYNRWITPRENARDRADRANQMLEAQGNFASEYNYRVQLWYENERKRLLEASYKELAKDLDEYEMYSDEWYEIYTQLQDVLTAIDDCTISTIEYKNAIRDLNNQVFDYKMERVSQITSENDFLLSLLENEKQFDDEGNPTKYYNASMGAHAVNYNVYMDKAKEYAKALQEINSELSSDPSNQKLIERREELLGLQQDSIKAAQDEKNAMVDLVKEGIDAQLDSLSKLISKYKDSLSSAKDLYEYQKRIKEQTKNIATLEKQLSAYSGFDDEETKAKIQQLKVDLESAKEDLKESEYDKYISDQEDLLDDLYDNYEKLLNEKVDDVNAVIREQIANVNMNQDEISNTLREISQRENYNYTDTLNAIYNGVNQLAEDKSNGGGSGSSTDYVIDEILDRYDSYRQKSEDWSKNEGTPSSQLEEQEKAASQERNKPKTEALNEISSLKNELESVLKSGKFKDNPEKYNADAKKLYDLAGKAVSNGYMSRTSDEYKDIVSIKSSIDKEWANYFWGALGGLSSSSEPTSSEKKQPQAPASKTSSSSKKETTSAPAPKKATAPSVSQNQKQLDELQKKLSAAIRSGDLKKNPNNYKKDISKLQGLLNTVISSGDYKKSDSAYKNALNVYNSANKILAASSKASNEKGENDSKTSSKKTIKVGGKINAKGAKIYATPGGKATTQYFGSDPIYVVLQEKNGYIQVRHHKAKNGYSGWFKKSDVKAYKNGGLVDKTGLAWLDGTPSKPETVLDANDSKNLMSLRDTLQSMVKQQGGITLAADYSKYRGVVPDSMLSHSFGSDFVSRLSSCPANADNSVNNTFGDTVINIDHVESYEDFMTKIQKDKKFEKMINAMTVARMTGGSPLAKNKYSWK